jgi:hypothetical protein
MTTTAEVLRQDRSTVLVIVRNGRCDVAEFIDALPLRARKKALRLIERVAASDNGPFDLRNDQKFKWLEEASSSSSRTRFGCCCSWIDRVER